MLRSLVGSEMCIRDRVNLNTLLPVRHLGLESTFGSGIAKVPLQEPLASVTKLPPSDPLVGVTYAVIACSSKNGKTLVLGLIPTALNDIVLLLINGTKATDITLLPKLCLKVCGTIVVLIPALVCTTSLLVVCTN